MASRCTLCWMNGMFERPGACRQTWIQPRFDAGVAGLVLQIYKAMNSSPL